ncbi:MAG: hypothetical protein QOJ68_1375 [Blastococcus sp.]|nr:hypothetical protein [Blastococcus sp.]
MRPEPADGGVQFLPGAAEAAFGVGNVIGDRTLTSGVMQTGPWSLDGDGRSCPGSLGVLIDDVLGYAVVSARPPGHWAVSTEIHADFARELPAPGAWLRAESSAVALSVTGGVASGVVRNAAGDVIAAATERLQFVPGEPSALSEAGTVEPVATGGGVAPASVTELLGARRTGSPGGAGLRFLPSEQLANPVGNLHGGVLFCAAGLAGQWALELGAAPLVLSSVHLMFVRPIRLHAEVRLEATAAHRGRTLGVAQVVVTDPGGRVCALATVTARGNP